MTKPYQRPTPRPLPIPKGATIHARVGIMNAVDRFIAARLPLAWEDEQRALKIQRDRIAKFLELTESDHGS